jgi:antitoxin component HigA of HigAB toxin-antitoxin module
MKAKSFKDYLETRLNKDDIAEIESAAKMEHAAIKALQEDVSNAVIHYMSDNNVGFNDFVRKLGKSPSQVSKIIKGEANLTITTIAQIFAIMGHKPHITSSLRKQ